MEAKLEVKSEEDQELTQRRRHDERTWTKITIHVADENRIGDELHRWDKEREK